MRVKMVIDDPLSQIREIAREWAKLNRERAERLGSGDEKVVLATITAEFSLPQRAKFAVLNWMDEQLRRAQDVLQQLEKTRDELLAKRGPLEQQLRYYVKLLEPIDRELATLNEQIFQVNADISSQHNLYSRVERASFRTLDDVRRTLQLVGLDPAVLEGGQDGTE